MGSQRVGHDWPAFTSTSLKSNALVGGFFTTGATWEASGKYPPTNAGGLRSSLGFEDPLEKEMATHSSILAWEIPWTEELGELQATWCKSQTWLSHWALYILLHKHIYLCSIFRGVKLPDHKFFILSNLLDNSMWHFSLVVPIYPLTLCNETSCCPHPHWRLYCQTLKVLFSQFVVDSCSL